LFANAATPDATIISLDIAFDTKRQAAIRRFARFHQKIICLAGNSHYHEVKRAVEARLKPHLLDVLYIDADHSYDGVAADFHLYSPLVRMGGVIIFHDIVPDYKARYGIKTVSDVGGVPQFWSEIKSLYPSTEEIIEDADQDGYGIGVLHWSGNNCV